jgi:DNA polymerase type B, organellar and viral
LWEGILNPDECLTALLSKAKRHKMVVYDLESKDGPTQRPGFTRVFLGGVYDGAMFTSFRNVAEVRQVHWEERGKKGTIPETSPIPWERRAVEDGGCIDQLMRHLLSNTYRGAYIYAHNGGGFDHLHVLPWLRARTAEFAWKVIPVQSSIQVLSVQHRSSKHTWKFLDSFRLLPMSLDQASKSFGFEGKLTHDLTMQEDDPRWETYLRRDCEALYEALQEFQSLLTDKLGGEMGITAPSSAMKLYRRKYMGHGKTPAMVPHHRHFKECQAVGGPQTAPHVPPKNEDGSIRTGDCEGCLHAWIRRGYYGGRVEVFRPRGEGVSYYDINSSYPRAMLEDMPGGEVRQYGPTKGIDAFAKFEQSAVGFVECEVDIPDTCYLPPLPHRDERTGKLLFPVGRFGGVWPWSELRLLSDPLVGGTILNIKRSVWYERKNLFFDFVKELYAYRDKSSAQYEEGLALICKLMMNSLYGKFGMNEDRREILVLGPGEDPPEGATFPRLESGEDDVTSKVCYVEKRVSPPYIIPQISAQITALARVRLWHCMADVLRRGGKLYYCDTDSLITNLGDLHTSSELGELKNEYPGETLTVELVGPKMYMLSKRTAFAAGGPQTAPHVPPSEDGMHHKLAMKGIPKDLRTVDTLRALQRGETVTFPRLERLGAMAGRQFVEPPRMRQAKKSMKAKNDKRVMVCDVDSRPIVLEIEAQAQTNGKANGVSHESVRGVQLAKQIPTPRGGLPSKSRPQRL